MTIAELAKTVNELKDTVLQFISAQTHYNELACKHEVDIRGNGKDGLFTTLVKLDGRLVEMEKKETRRQKLVDGLVAAFALMAAIEILRLVATALQ